MELSELQQLSYLIESLTTSSKSELDKVNLKKLKSMCKKSNEYVEHAFRLLFTQLEIDHSEVRLNAVLIVDELFQRSHAFRELLLDNLTNFLELTAGINFDMPLPEPTGAAKELMKKSVKCVHAWHQKYGPAYKKLDLGYNFLKSSKKIQLVNADEVQTQIQRNALEERKRKKDEHNKKRLEKLTTDIENNIMDIKSCLAEMEACFTLLVPKFDDDETNEPGEQSQTDESRQTGFLSHSYNIELDLSKDIFEFMRVNRTEDNAVILENLRDREKIMKNVHLPRVKKWLAHLGMCGAPSELLKQIIDLKTAITKCIEKNKDMIVSADQPSTSGVSSNNILHEESEDSSDDDFEEVLEKPKLFNSHASQNINTDVNKKITAIDTSKKESSKLSSNDTNVWKPIRSDDNLNDPTSYSRALAVQKEQLESLKRDNTTSDSFSPPKIAKIHPKSLKLKQSTSKLGNRQTKAEIPAPIVSFGPDLLEWDESKKQELKETLSMGAAKALDIGHRFWSADTASRGDAVSEAALTALTTRSIAFTGEFEPVKWSCRAPLPSGRLCPRKDRHKCPFHGKIIPRDPNGNPTDPEDIKKIKKDSNETDTTEHWQDPALLRELKAITGIDLKMPDKKGTKRKKKGKKEKYENLTNVKDIKDTSRHRLEKKVLDPKSIKRVSETLERIETKRNMQKFGNNFNYALN
uniref:UV-stimulated scaffold protein A-like n=1 Tax=Styela clava TaxID=7725 RepID=UPI001939EB92|nr:UV-stimulated scaffold protein A-like [Styela clava]